MQIHFVTGDGEITDKQVKRAEFLDFFRNRTKCLIGMEACGASQDWARKLEAMGHEVHLMSPKAVKPFVSGQKNDYNDAIGIYKAMFNGVRRVPVKSTEIRDLQTLRRIRSQVTKDKVKEINHVRGLLAEYGIVLGKSITAFNKGISSALESLKERGDVSPLVAEELRTTVESIKTKIERQKRLDREIEQLARGCKTMRIFSKLPESVHSRRQCSAYYFVTRPFLQMAANCSLYRTSAKKPRLRRQKLYYRHTLEIQLRQRIQSRIC